MTAPASAAAPFGAGYAWAVEEPAGFEVGLAGVRAPARGGVEGVLTSGVEWVLREAGLLAVLERVSGDAGALHGAAVAWMEQAVAVRGVSGRVRREAVPVAGSWRGEASRAFGAAMGAYVDALDRVAFEMASTAHLLNRAGVAGGAAEDAVVGIVGDAAGWVAAELAATAVADVLTFGLASVGGALAGSATLAAFVARAERVSARLASVVEQVAAELAELRAARDAIRAARGLSALRSVHQARETVRGMRGSGRVLRAAEGAADGVLGEAAGLPLGASGPKSLGSQVRRTIEDEAEDIAQGQ